MSAALLVSGCINNENLEDCIVCQYQRIVIFQLKRRRALVLACVHAASLPVYSSAMGGVKIVEIVIVVLVVDFAMPARDIGAFGDYAAIGISADVDRLACVKPPEGFDTAPP